jgi:hypothetical protein
VIDLAEAHDDLRPLMFWVGTIVRRRTTPSSTSAESAESTALCLLPIRLGRRDRATCEVSTILRPPTLLARDLGTRSDRSRYYMLCFSDLEPGSWGPRRIQQSEIRTSFGDGWRVEDIHEARMEMTIEPGSVRGWLASIQRL